MAAVLDGRSLNAETLARLVKSDEAVGLSPEAIQRNRATFERANRALQDGTAVYGLSTGVGALKSVTVPQGEAPSHQARLLKSHAAGAGEKVPAEIVRALLIVRLNQLGAGGAGVHPRLLESLERLANEKTSLKMHELGGVGTGDLAQLAVLGLALAERSPLGPRDGLMLMSSNAYAIAEAALGCAVLGIFTRAIDAVASLTFEAAGARPEPLDPEVQAARPHPGQVASAAHLRQLLIGYEPQQPRLQDSFGFRCIPQVHGVLHEAWSGLDRVLKVELNAAAENPLLVDRGPLSNGNFHAAMLVTALDTARSALAQVAGLSTSRLSDLFDERITGLGAFLAQAPGPDSGAMILEYPAAAALAELRMLAAPAAVQPSVLSHGIEHGASHAPLAARSLTRSRKLAAIVFACELVAAVRALRMRGKTPMGAGTRQLYELASAKLPAALEDRPLADDLDCALELLLELGQTLA